MTETQKKEASKQTRRYFFDEHCRTGAELENKLISMRQERTDGPLSDTQVKKMLP